MSNPQPSDTVMEIGRNLHPRRYHRFKDLRPDLEAVQWARSLDWRNNPYDRFLLRREILHYLEGAGAVGETAVFCAATNLHCPACFVAMYFIRVLSTPRDVGTIPGGSDR